ncbi:MAG: ImmA/IrrE family metallo-endopeptidase [Clostridia bacterium]|nr:ImmA/IrrE family metallo-endopeptidase [Clostridia bacterium]
MAAKVLVARRVTSLPVSPLAMLHACRDTRVYTMEGAVEAAGISRAELERLFRLTDAVTYWYDEGATRQCAVIFREDGNPARMRFTLAHEMGHRVLRHQGMGEREEREADCFASHLLCPEAVVRRICERAANPEAAIDRIAEVCYVTRACARAAVARRRIALPSQLQAAMEDLAAVVTGGGLPKDE